MHVEAHGASSHELGVSWIDPAWYYRLPDPTGYTLQWKLASASWSDAAAVSERKVIWYRNPYSPRIGGLAANTLYSVKVSAFNDAGPGPFSQEVLGRTQFFGPQGSSGTVNGSTVTLDFGEQLDQTSVPLSSSFFVLADAGIREVTSVAINGSSVIITLAKPVNPHELVRANYVEPNDPDAIALRLSNGDRIESDG